MSKDVCGGDGFLEMYTVSECVQVWEYFELFLCQCVLEIAACEEGLCVLGGCVMALLLHLFNCRYVDSIFVSDESEHTYYLKTIIYL